MPPPPQNREYLYHRVGMIITHYKVNCRTKPTHTITINDARVGKKDLFREINTLSTDSYLTKEPIINSSSK